MNKLFWFGSAGIILGGLLDFLKKWLVVIPRLFGIIVFWCGVGILVIALLMALIVEVKKFVKEMRS